MSDVQPTNNPVPSDHPADARDNFKRIDEVVNLQAAQTSPTRTGRVLNTLYGLEANYSQTPINGGVWAAGIQFTAYNQYMVYQGVAYRPRVSTPLPYTSQAAPNPDFVQPFNYSEEIEPLEARVTLVEGRVSTNESDISALQAGQGSGVVAFATQAELFSNLNFDERTPAYVTNDPTATNNGTYRKVGASGSGSWVQSSNDLASQAYQLATDNQEVITPAVERTVFFDRNKPLNNFVRKNAVGSGFNNNAITTALYSFRAETSNPILGRSGEDQFTTDARSSVRGESFSVGTMVGRTVFLGWLEYIDPSQSGVPTSFGSGVQVNNLGVESVFIPDTRGNIQITDDVWLIWAKKLETDPNMSNGHHIVAPVSQYDRSKLAFAHFIAYGDASIAWEDIDIFNQNERDDDFEDHDQYLTATHGRPDWSDATDPVSMVVTDNEIVRGIIPSGHCLARGPSDITQATFKYDFEGDRLNQYWYFSFYAYQPNDNTPSSKRVWNVQSGTKNGNSFVTAKDVRTSSTEYGGGLSRIDIRGKFEDVHDTSYGGWMSIRFSVGSGDCYAFGIIAGVSDSIHDREALTPRYYNASKIVQPIAPDPIETVDSIWRGSKVVWFGTSIPDGSEYPSRVTSNIGATLSDLTRSGGRLGAMPEDTKVPQDNTPQLFNFTFSQSDRDVHYTPNVGQEVDPDNYSVLQPGSGFTLTQSVLDTFMENFFEHRLIGNLDADLYIMDYGTNDVNLNTSSPWVTPANAPDDGTTFAGAFKRLYTYIHASNPLAKWLIVSHHNRTRNQGTRDAVDSQELISHEYGTPLADMATNLGLNNINLTDFIPDELHPPVGGEIDLAYARQITDKLNSL